MAISKKVFAYLQNRDARVTKHLKTIINTIISHSSPVDAKTIYHDLKLSEQTIDLSTIHRILDKLHNLGVLDSLYGEKANYYELSSKFLPHHHHFTCIKCGKITDINSCMIDPIFNKIIDIGTPISHSFEIKGICNKCK
ncbi:MAG: hypothetical protein RLZZ223_204 [Candidatus Parcubacteria bacterium]|jgi:Fur family zinc uptake transcriptional regulator